MGTISEKWGRRLSSTEAEFLYFLDDYDDAATAQDALEAHVNSDFQGLVRDDVEVEELEGHANQFFGRVLYSDPSSSGESDPAQNLQKPGDSTISFDTSGATAHITRPFRRRDGIGRDGADVGDEEWPIGSHANGDETEGVDVTAPKLEIIYTRIMADAEIDAALVTNLYDLTGKVNGHHCSIGAFGFDPQQLLFKGARLTQRGNGDWELQEAFGASPNDAEYETGMDKVEGGQYTVNKGGWDYVWWRLEIDPDEADGGEPKDRVSACLSDQVYHEGNLRNLPGVGA